MDGRAHLQAEQGGILVRLQALKAPPEGHVLLARVAPLGLGARQLALQLAHLGGGCRLPRPKPRRLLLPLLELRVRRRRRRPMAFRLRPAPKHMSAQLVTATTRRSFS